MLGHGTTKSVVDESVVSALFSSLRDLAEKNATRACQHQAEVTEWMQRARKEVEEAEDRIRVLERDVTALVNQLRRAAAVQKLAADISRHVESLSALCASTLEEAATGTLGVDAQTHSGPG